MTVGLLVVLVAANLALGVELAARLPRGTPTFWERHWKLGVTVLGVCVVVAALVDA